MTSKELSKCLREIANPEYAIHSQRFFKTGIGEYGEGDKFLGVRVPVLRKYAKKYSELSLTEIHKLLKSVYHEERLCALFLLVQKFDDSKHEKSVIYRLYLDNTKYINSWDLVDCSAYKIVGPYLADKNKSPLYMLAKSKDLWERRIAIISTLHFIKNKHYDDTLEISKKLLNDEEELIHKAVGWMLREVGKQDYKVERSFLLNCYKKMPRMMLRYAIEKFPEPERKKYLRGTI
ncbi:MAG: DNA alkylation repair protein [Gammaproteobacteria bacterium]|nr:DNA alkylation repair protein [Gammaproteobacteria bacterium]MBT8123711.1 DNA alkylation repair protein [Gammaproteobacteria bacterium]